jgi:hypothetical protein
MPSTHVAGNNAVKMESVIMCETLASALYHQADTAAM